MSHLIVWSICMLSAQVKSICQMTAANATCWERCTSPHSKCVLCTQGCQCLMLILVIAPPRIQMKCFYFSYTSRNSWCN
ncbi:hypothetical protein C0J52_02079 [Blattella germanica]|nr:hypothetical protein C0J52_02079 [Blattella germanica]